MAMVGNFAPNAQLVFPSAARDPYQIRELASPFT